MIIFWICIALVSAAAAALILQGAAELGRVGPEAEDPSLAVYRRQIREIDDLADRGLIEPEEQQSTRTEAARRLLGASDRAVAPVSAERPSARLSVLAVAGLIPVLALGVYMVFGAPGLADQPFAKRLAEWRKGDPSALTGEQLLVVLNAVVEEHPKDPKPLLFLARVQSATGDDGGAVRSLEKAVRLSPNDARLWTSLGEGLVVAANGVVEGDAARAFNQALKLDPKDPSARYHLARAQIAKGQVAEGLKVWRAVRAELPRNDPRASGLALEIAAVERRGGLEAPKPVPQPLTGVDADQMAFIRSMVESLAPRLKASPDDPQGWARLVRSYGVLGDKAAQSQALSEARRLFKDRPDALRTVEAAAQPASPK
jgi:cytochrome c-type biogenesis protein CcmH